MAENSIKVTAVTGGTVGTVNIAAVSYGGMGNKTINILSDMPPKQQRGRLNPEDEERLRINFELLNTDLDGKDLVDKMFEKGIFSIDDAEEVRNAMPNIRKRRTEIFLHKLFNSGVNGYGVFIEALNSEGYEFIADKLEKTIVPSQVQGADWFECVPASRKVDKVMEKDLSRMVSGLGNGWEFVAIELNVKQTQIEQLKMSSSSPQLQMFNVFVKWRQREAGKATFQAFVRALQACEDKCTIDWDIIKNVVLNGQ